MIKIGSLRTNFTEIWIRIQRFSFTNAFSNAFMLFQATHYAGYISSGLKHQKLFSNIFDGLVQDCSNSSALALELLQSSTKPSICGPLLHSIVIHLTQVWTRLCIGCIFCSDAGILIFHSFSKQWHKHYPISHAWNLGAEIMLKSTTPLTACKYPYSDNVICFAYV